MKISISPAKSNTYPKKGILIKGKSPNEWLPILQLLVVDLIETPVYPIPSKIANELYGCFVVLNKFSDTVRQLNVSVFQSIDDYIYIPEFSEMKPKISKEEAISLFKSPQVFHQNFNWVALNEPIIWKGLLQLEASTQTIVTKPAKTVFSPKRIKSFQIKANEDIDIVKELNLTVAPSKKDTLTSFDKVKLRLFTSIFSSKKNQKGGFDIEGRGLFKWLKSNSSNTNNRQKSKWKTDFEKLLFRNQKETDKLLSLFKSNPNLALSKALPLDMLGTSRGSGEGVFSVSRVRKQVSFSKFIMIIFLLLIMLSVVFLAIKLIKGQTEVSNFLKMLGVFIFVLLLFLKNFSNESSGSTRRGGGSTANIDSERMNALRKEYEKLAEEAIKNKEYKKAASIYIKLLKNNYKAATILEEGKYYQEAALIYLKYSHDKNLAAKAYEKGKYYNKAINLYKELNQNEKVGDLYKLIDDKEEADKHFQIVIDSYLANNQYVKASLIYKYKIEDSSKAQEKLLKGWRENKDAYNCLNNYFGNIVNKESLKEEIQFISKEETNDVNIYNFLKALKHEHSKHEEIQNFTQNIAYEIIAKYIKENPSIAFSLNDFNANNSLLNTDTSRFVRQEKKKRK